MKGCTQQHLKMGTFTQYSACGLINKTDIKECGGCTMTIKEIFDKAESGTLTYAQFEELTKDAKFADLSTGEYVSKMKYEDELSGRDNQIKTLNDTISNRDKDLKTLKEQLETASENGNEELKKLTADMASLQEKYNSDMKAYKTQLAEQSYEFAVKEYANGIEFSSAAAKRDFIGQLKNAGLKMDGNMILGADDFRARYQESNSDAFPVKTEPKKDPESLPQFIGPTGTPDTGKKFSLSELMKMKNENPELNI